MRIFKNRGGAGIVPNWKVVRASWRWLPDRLARIVGRYYPDTKVRARTELLRYLPKASIGAEVGVWRGDFSAVLLHALDPERLHLVDPWTYRENRDEAWFGGARATSQQEMDAVARAVSERFRGDSRVRIHRATSVQAAAEFDDATLDWVYIDADHVYESVRDDLAAWKPKVRPGGIVAGDDFGQEGWWQNGVTLAVREYFRDGSLEPLLLHGGQYVLRKPKG